MRSRLPADFPKEGEVFDGKYRIGRVLGVGGMAVVIAARHLGFDETVALKILLPDFCNDPVLVARFLQEGRAATKIRSEHVVRMFDVGKVGGRAFLVMEYLDGTDLEVLLRDKGPLSVETAVDFVLQACEAIGEAHVLGIVHRDLKPANLFLTHRADGTPCVKVLDFGISKMQRGESAGGAATLPSLFMGSPQYMSPEQMASAAMVDPRSDIWSIGTILYELLTGQLAFGGSTTAEVCARVLDTAPDPLERHRRDLPQGVAGVIARCLEKDPARRFVNVAELARALAPYGTARGQASAESIARIVEGGIALRATRSSVGTIKAVEVTPTRSRGTPLAAYLVAAILALAVFFTIRHDSAGTRADTFAGARITGASPMPAAIAASASPPAPLPPAPAAPPAAEGGAAGPVSPDAVSPAKHHHTHGGGASSSPTSSRSRAEERAVETL